jgi:hypothetical protein
MTRIAIAILAGLIVGNPATAHRAAADPLAIQSGYVFLNENPATSFGLDFGFFGDDFSFLGEDFNLEYFRTFSPDEPPFRLQFRDVADPATSSCTGCTYSGDFLFEFPATTIGEAVPFTMTGLLRGFRGDSPIPVIDQPLAGIGRVNPGAQSVLFEFTDTSPVPEPSTMLLLGSGLALGLRNRLRRRVSRV